MFQGMSHILQLEPQNLQTKPQTLQQTTAKSTGDYKLHWHTAKFNCNKDKMTCWIMHSWPNYAQKSHLIT